MKCITRAWLSVWTLIVVTGCASTGGDAGGRFDIGLIGDQHYDARSTAQFPNIMADMDRAALAFVVHVGDIGAPVFGSCLDETYLARRAEFDASRHPFIYTPGDNEWADCHQAGIPDSLERLGKLRDVFFQGGETLGRRRLSLARQSADPPFAPYRENARWSMGGVVFATLHLPGSNNNLARTPQMDAEHAARNAANLAWLRAAFEHAKQTKSSGLMLFIQANPKFEFAWPLRRRNGIGYAPPPKRPDGYAAFVAALTREVLAYDRPVALVHGDTHYFRVDKPIIIDDKSGAGRGRIVEHFTRVELFGYPESHWVRATIDPADPNVFSFRPQIVRENTGGPEAR